MPATNFIQVFMRTAVNVWFCLNSIGAVGHNQLPLTLSGYKKYALLNLTIKHAEPPHVASQSK